MKVESELVHHPKFLRFKKAAGAGAMEILIRLWGHCENAQRGEFWRGADATYVETVAGWDGDEGKLFEMLEACRWIEVSAAGIRIHDWNAHNWRRVTNWRVGLAGGRRKRTQSEPKANPVVNPPPTQCLTPLTELTELTDIEKKGGAANPADVQASVVQFAALKDQVKDLERKVAESSGEEKKNAQIALREKKAAMKDVQRRQSRREFGGNP